MILSIALTKLDVLDTFDEIKAGVAYRLNKQLLKSPPCKYYLYKIQKELSVNTAQSAQLHLFFNTKLQNYPDF